MREYFEAELRLLRDTAQEFAEAYPEQAGLLNLHHLKDKDPHVERLLEGFAFLTAMIKRKMDDQIPEISEVLLEQLWPAMLRPFPSCCVAQFKSRQNLLQKSYCVTQGTRLRSNAVGDENTSVQFTTLDDIWVHPLHIAGVEMQEQRGRSTLHLQLQVDSAATLHAIEWDVLPLYIHAEHYTTLELLFALSEDVQRIDISFEPSINSTPATQQLGGPDCIVPYFQENAMSMMASTGRDRQGFHILQEYFAFPEKKNFLLLKGLEQVQWPQQCRSFNINFHLNRVLSSDVHLHPKVFQLYCVPAMNVFETTTEPLYIDNTRAEYPVYTDHQHRDSIQTLSVKCMEGRQVGSQTRTTYLPFQSFQHDKNNTGYYHVRRRKLTDKPAQLTVFLAGQSTFHTQTLTCEITACNGDYPHRFVKENHLQAMETDINAVLSGTNLTRPTTILYPPEHNDYQWQLIAHLALNYNLLTQLDRLKELLTLYNWTGRVDHERRIDAIKQVSLNTTQCFQKGMLVHCLEIDVAIYEGPFQSLADLYQFARVLHHFFLFYRPLNYWVRTQVTCQPSNRIWVWTMSL